MKELIKYLKDVRFWGPAGFLIGFELFLQSGLYRNLMQPRSYADNVQRIVDVAAQSNLKPRMLILGTSVAYQGINVRQLNEILADPSLQTQSGACEGAQLETQHLIYKALEKQMPDLKIVIHINEATFPWTARTSLDQPNRSMVAQFPRRMAFSLLRDYGFQLTVQDWTYFIFRSLTYQKDLRDFVVDPLDRFKGIGRRMREGHVDYVYENPEEFKLSAYHAKNLKECVDISSKGIPEFDVTGKKITDQHHQIAVLRTCAVGMVDPIDHPGAEQWGRLYFRRLKMMYDEMYARGLTVITVFPPYADLIQDLNQDSRVTIWREELKKLHGNRPYGLIDMRHSLDGPNNGDFYYDTIHLNRFGAARFTEELAKRLRQEKLVTGR